MSKKTSQRKPDFAIDYLNKIKKAQLSDLPQILLEIRRLSNATSIFLTCAENRYNELMLVEQRTKKGKRLT